MDGRDNAPDEERETFTPIKFLLAIVLIALFGAALAFLVSVARASDDVQLPAREGDAYALAGAPSQNAGDIVIRLPNGRNLLTKQVVRALRDAAFEYRAWLTIRIDSDYSRKEPEPKTVAVSFYETRTTGAALAKRCFAAEFPIAGIVYVVELQRVGNDAVCADVDNFMDKLINRFLVKLYIDGN